MKNYLKGPAVLFNLILLTFVLSVSSPIAAQENNDGEFLLEEITVTAQKRSENQQKVGVAMDVISSDEINGRGMTDIDQILSNVAGVMVNKSGDGLRVTIRGISQDSGGFVGAQSSAPTVAVNQDGVFSARNSTGSTLYDMERVEVLLGPQSTVYASNSPGGIVNIITADPKLDYYEGSGSIEYGSYDYLRTEGMVNIPVTENFGLRAAFTTSVRDGYLDNGGDDEDKKSARLKALYHPTEKMSFLISAEKTRDTGKMGFASAVTAFEDQDEAGDPWTASSDSFPGKGDSTQDKLSARFDLDLGFGEFSIIPAYASTEADYEQVQTMGEISIEGQSHQEGWEKGIESRLVSSDDSFITWLVGANYYKSEDNYNMVGSDGSVGIEINKIDTKAVYGNATYPVSDEIRVTAGLRKTWEETYQYALRMNTENTTEPEYDDIDYSVGVEYDLVQDSMIYATYATGYRTQAAQAYDGDGNAFPHETVKSYTIGSKNRFLDNKLQLNVAGYYYDYANYPADDMVQTLDLYDYNGDGLYDLTDVPDPENPGGTRDETQVTTDDYARTVGDLDVYGLEIQATMIITNNDLVDLSVSYMNSEYSNLYFDYMDITNSLGIEDADYSGKSKTNSPEWTVDFAYSHIFDLPNGGSLTARFDSRYQSEYFLVWKENELSLDSAYNAIITDIAGYRTQEAYHLSNISAVYAHPDGKWTLSGYVKNLEDYAVKKSWISGQMQIGSPRTYGAILSVKY